MKRKPEVKPLIDVKGKHLDDIVVCGHCGAFICYPEDEDKELIEGCDHCGMPVDWEGGVVDEVRPKKLNQPKEERKEE